MVLLCSVADTGVIADVADGIASFADGIAKCSSC